MPAKPTPRATWMSQVEHWPTLCHHSFSSDVYLPSRPWLYQLSLREFHEWFWSQAETQPNGCRLWRPGDLWVTLEGGWSERADRVAWCLVHRHEPGPWLHLVRDCPNDHCVEPAHLYFAGALADFYRRVRRNEAGCWIWQGAQTTTGYGRHFVEGGEVRAHRYSWEYEYGPIPGGKYICHTCDTPACVHPKHLFLTDHIGNMADMVDKGRQAHGARHPRARFDLDDARFILSEALEGRPVREIAQLWFVSEGTVRLLLWGEHWIQREPLPIDGDVVDLRTIEIQGVIEQVSVDRQINDDYCIPRFRLQPQMERPPASRGWPVAMACRAMVAASQGDVVEHLAAGRRQLTIRGQLSRPSGRAVGHRRPAFEIRVSEIRVNTDG